MYRIYRKDLYPSLIWMDYRNIEVYLKMLHWVFIVGYWNMCCVCCNIITDDVSCNWIRIGITEKLAAFVHYLCADTICFLHSTLSNYKENKFNNSIYVTFHNIFKNLFNIISVKLSHKSQDSSQLSPITHFKVHSSRYACFI